MIVENERLIGELKSGKENYLQILDLVDVIFIVTDSNNIIRMINKKGCLLLGHKRKELTGKNLSDFIPDHAKNDFNCLWEKLFNGGDDTKDTYEIPILNDIGQERLIRWHNILLSNAKGNVEYIVSSCEDISEKKEGKVEEEQKELINKLLKLNESKDSLFSLISHDLRSPFNSLLGFSEILTSEYDTLTHDEIREYLNVIYETSKNLFRMTNNLLQFSRFQIGRIDYNPVELEFNKVVIRVLALLRGNSIKKQITVIVEIPEDIKVLADEDMVNSILQNLISNAIKFTQRGGKINISAGIHTNAEGRQMAEVVVKDNGVGIENELKEKLFKDHVPSSSGTDKEYGTGLGLLLVKEFLEQNGGKISVISQVNEGSTFTFTLPIV